VSVSKLIIVADISDDNAKNFLTVILRYFDKFLPTVGEFMIYEKPVKKINAANWLRKANRNSFNIQAGDWDIHAASIASMSVNVFYIENMASALDSDWWVAEVAANIPMKQALLVSSDYNYWQNADSLLEYESAGKSWRHLPTKSNGLPFPLEQTVIDTSGNPGRFTFKEGYVEAIGSVMWLSEGFLRQVNSSVERITALSWVKVLPFANGLWRVQSADEPFSSDQGESAARQNALRSALYSSAPS
jgi:hypothetical protein